jgi:hypothetical protein
MTAQDKVKETVREEAQRVAELAQEAAQSGAYLYPIRVMNAMSMTTCEPKLTHHSRASSTSSRTASSGSLS